MKKTISLFALLAFLCMSTTFAQIIPLPTGPCGPNSGTNIFAGSIPGTYTTSPAQLYSWQVVSGNATIISGLGTQTVTVSCNGPFTLSVVTIHGTRSSSNCQTFNCEGGCPVPGSISFIPEIERNRCKGGTAFLTGVPPRTQINWVWTLGGQTDSLSGVDPFIDLGPFATGTNWNGQTLEICANLTLNGIACPEVCVSVVLDCDDPFISIRKKASVFPNPTTNLVSVQPDNTHQLSRVIVTDNQGRFVKSMEQDFSRKIDLSKEKKGTYFIRFLYKDGTSETKQLQLKK